MHNTKKEKISSVKGMNDILPPASAGWEWLEAKVRDLMARYAYRNIRTPIVENTALFVRGLGEVTDIVEKEMYSFEDRLNGELLTLRPESTAGVVRAVTEHSLLYDGGKRLYYMGPMFRHERPQRGRYRQFHQIGAEALGFPGAEVDAELILLANALWKELGLENIRLELNTLGQPAERKAHRAALIQYFEQHLESLDDDAKRRLHSNPLRILDSKNPAMQGLIEGAPRLRDYLDAESLAHFELVTAILDANGVAWQFNARLVRGLDYYNRTVFEFVTDDLGSQGTICGGGRYDYLIEEIGGKPAPAVGWAMGVERVFELLNLKSQAFPMPAPDAYAVLPDAHLIPAATVVLEALRRAGVQVQMHTPGSASDGMGSMKSQLRRADASGARHAIIFGADEFARGACVIKSLRDGTGAQSEQPLADAGIWAVSLILSATS
ncbi:histidine--tRNA ligase [Simplicispira suum]|uniref:Histidine--tRNA ligase n=1 Tax=Simplicispira suum TaxID=2109915 RepID=A0A2S0N282_9BURK|nr:histidine--tRNA ligase [Simplicispira suum]AVO42245.1 histidine--tRNA ligase [Simplicispira suum]MBW7831658.1 histidine--tRNA ligase [Simplicispira suum]